MKKFKIEEKSTPRKVHVKTCFKTSANLQWLEKDFLKWSRMLQTCSNLLSICWNLKDSNRVLATERVSTCLELVETCIGFPKRQFKVKTWNFTAIDNTYHIVFREKWLGVNDVILYYDLSCLEGIAAFVIPKRLEWESGWFAEHYRTAVATLKNF